VCAFRRVPAGCIEAMMMKIKKFNNEEPKVEQPVELEIITVVEVKDLGGNRKKIKVRL